jgi:hypothetical protein
VALDGAEGSDDKTAAEPTAGPHVARTALSAPAASCQVVGRRDTRQVCSPCHDQAAVRAIGAAYYWFARMMTVAMAPAITITAPAAMRRRIDRWADRT